MARIEWVRLRLNNWALWKERESSGGLGWSTQSVLLSEPGGRDGYRESIVPVDDVDAGLTNTAVESLKPTRGHLYETLQLMYPKGKGVVEAARILGCAHSTIHARLEEADRALREWFNARQEAQKKSFTA